MYDVVVVGGGVSGAMAGIASARTGSKTLIVEKAHYLGGTLTNCGVGPMMTFFAGEKQVIKGLFQEVVDRLVEKGYSNGHVLDTTTYISYLTSFSSEGLKYVLDDMAVEAGCDLLFDTTLAKVDVVEDKIQSITVCNKAGLTEIQSKVFIDATGDADLAYFANVPTTKGRKEDGAMQPMTLNMKYINVDTTKMREHIYANTEKEFPRMYKDINLLKTVDQISAAGWDAEFNAAKERGEISIPREDVLLFETNVKGEFILNTTRVVGKDATNPTDVTEAELIGRRQARELDAFLKKYVAGFENAHLEITGPFIGVRGSRQIVGVYTLTDVDVVGMKEFDDRIAHCGYPIDIHSPTGEGTNSIHLEDGDYYQIPYSIMVTNELSNLLVTGRCVSATFEAQAAIRVTPPAAAMGQAAGVAAAIAVADCKDVKEISICKLQDTLIARGAYIEK